MFCLPPRCRMLVAVLRDACLRALRHFGHVNTHRLEHVADVDDCVYGSQITTWCLGPPVVCWWFTSSWLASSCVVSGAFLVLWCVFPILLCVLFSDVTFFLCVFPPVLCLSFCVQRALPTCVRCLFLLVWWWPSLCCGVIALLGCGTPLFLCCGAASLLCWAPLFLRSVPPSLLRLTSSGWVGLSKLTFLVLPCMASPLFHKTPKTLQGFRGPESVRLICFKVFFGSGVRHNFKAWVLRVERWHNTA